MKTRLVDLVSLPSKLKNTHIWPMVSSIKFHHPLFVSKIANWFKWKGGPATVPQTDPMDSSVTKKPERGREFFNCGVIGRRGRN